MKPHFCKIIKVKNDVTFKNVMGTLYEVLKYNKIFI